jgi:hypothetical protein
MTRRFATISAVVFGLTAATVRGQDGAAPPACGTAGCFEGQTRGVTTATINGRAAYRVTPDGEFMLVLAGSGAEPVTVVVARDAGGAPAADTRFALDAPDCDSDGDSDDDAPRPAPPGVRVSVRGGAPASPAWLAKAHAGSLHLSPSADGGIAGTIELTGCGETVERGDHVTITMRGSFRARRSK